MKKEEKTLTFDELKKDNEEKETLWKEAKEEAEAEETTESTTEEKISDEELLRQLNQAASSHTTVTSIDQIIEDTRAWMSHALTIEEEDVTNPDRRKLLVSEIMTKINNLRNDELARMTAEEVALRKGGDKDITRAVVGNFNRLLPVQPYLPTKIICDILAKAGIVKLLDSNGEEGTRDERAELLIYRLHDKKGVPTVYKGINEDGSLEEPDILRIIAALSSHTSKAQRSEMISLLRDIAPRVYAPRKPDSAYIYAANGIIDCHGIRWNPIMGLNQREDGSLATFIPWGTPEAEAIIEKELPLRYSTAATYIDDPGLQPPAMYTTRGDAWDPVNGIKALFEDSDDISPAIVWEIIQAAVRGTNHGKGIIFANQGGSQGGGNGKDTLLGILKELLGEYNTMPVSIHELGTKEFPLDGLQNKGAILSSEEPTGKTDAALFKLLVRQDNLIPIARKHLPTLYLGWRGMTIWTLNGDSINFTDKSDSPWRGLIVIHFEKSFDAPGAKKIPEIKEDFIHRKETRDYSLWHAINKTPWVGPEGYDKDLLDALEENRRKMRMNSNPTFVFLNEMLLGDPSQGIEPKIPWTQTPTAFLYSIYKIWAKKDNAMERITATQNGFTKQAKQWASEHSEAFIIEEGNAKLGSNEHRAKLTTQDCEALSDYRPVETPRTNFVGQKAVLSDAEAEKQYRNRLVRITPLEDWKD